MRRTTPGRIALIVAATVALDPAEAAGPPGPPKSESVTLNGTARLLPETLKSSGMAFDRRITQVNYPLPLSGRDEVPAAVSHFQQAIVVELVYLPASFTFEEGLAILAEKGLFGPNYEHAIRFFVKHGLNFGSNDHVVFLCKGGARVAVKDVAFSINGTDGPADGEIEVLDPLLKFPGDRFIAGIRFLDA